MVDPPAARSPAWSIPLARTAKTASIPVVIVTASDATIVERQRLKGAVTAVIGKAGFDSDVFMAEVRAATGAGAAGARTDVATILLVEDNATNMKP